MKKSWRLLAVFPLMLLLLFSFSCKKQGKEATVQEKPEEEAAMNELPQAIMDGLMAKFPEAEIQKWAKEQEEDMVVYDIEFKQEDMKFEADIKEDGTIYNWEKEIEAQNLPEAVQNAIDTKFPDSSIKEVMEITAVKDGEDVLEGYEVTLETADMEEVEITLAPDGKVLEDSGEEKQEEEK